MSELKRIKEQEDNINVFRWFENEDVIGSVVAGYFYNELNLRISINWKKGDPDGLKEIRGGKDLMLLKSDEFWIEKIKFMIKEHKKFKNMEMMAV